MGFELNELNASDVRSKNNILTALKDVALGNALLMKDKHGDMD